MQMHVSRKSLKLIPTVLVTGSARRIGAAIATYLHHQGFRVILHCHHSIDAATSLANLLNGKRQNTVKILTADLRNKDELQQLLIDGVAWAGRLDTLVNNASVFSKHEADWDDMFHVNVKAPFWLSQFARPYLNASHGCIVNITDSHADKPLKDYAMYCQTKAALAMQTKALAREFAPDIRVNAVAPGAIAWPEGNNALSLQKKQTILAKTLLKCHGDPIFIAKAVYGLIENTFVTGQTWIVDGGRLG